MLDGVRTTLRELSPDQPRGRYDNGRYNGANAPQWPPPYRSYGPGRQSEQFHNSGRNYGTMPEDFRAPVRRGPGELARRFPQSKRRRFSDFLQRQTSNTSGGTSGTPSPQRNFAHENKGNRGREKKPQGENQTAFGQTHRGSKRERDDGNSEILTPGISSLEPSFGELNVNAPPKTGFRPMPPNNSN